MGRCDKAWYVINADCRYGDIQVHCKILSPLWCAGKFHKEMLKKILKNWWDVWSLSFLPQAAVGSWESHSGCLALLYAMRGCLLNRIAQRIHNWGDWSNGLGDVVWIHPPTEDASKYLTCFSYCVVIVPKSVPAMQRWHLCDKVKCKLV